MQSLVRQTTMLGNPFMGNRMSMRVAPTPAPAPTAFRDVTTMAKRKGVRIIVTIECTEARPAGETPSRYVTQKVRHATHVKPVGGQAMAAIQPLGLLIASDAVASAPCDKQNRRNDPERLELKKYNPNLKRVTLHREIKSK